jgi:mannose-6-phosphate isomerase-like protein (cupin superfamily)
MSFPGGIGVSQIQVYDWPGPDGACGGSPHLHTASAEAYVVTAGQGHVQTLSGDGYAETPLAPGTVLWFTPGTVHRLVTGGGLRITVLMQNAGLPEAGDAVFTFPPAILADPVSYAAAATLPAGGDHDAAARGRRDLAVEGFLALREAVRGGGPGALRPLHEAAARLVRDRVGGWQDIWRDGPLADAERTGERLRALAAGDATHLAGSQLITADDTAAQRYGMCGRLTPVRGITNPTTGADR